MTTTKLAIKSDVRERLSKIRKGYVYDGIKTFVRELVQNSYRAKADCIYVTLDGNTFTIEDNGIGCDNPKKLFTLDYSGFGVGYGEGFNSIYMVADRFKVETMDWIGTLDIVEALDNPKSTIDDLMVSLSSRGFSETGFRLTLEGEKISNYRYDIEQEVYALCKYLPHIETYVNGQLVEKENLLEKIPSGEFTSSVDNHLYTGKITLTNDYYGTGIEVYHEYRLVQTLDIPGANGVILLKPNAVNLRAPDRTAIIHDDKRRRLNKKLVQEITFLLKQLVAKGNGETITDYSKIIQEYLDVKQYINYLYIDESILRKEVERERAEEERQASELDSSRLAVVIENLVAESDTPRGEKNFEQTNERPGLDSEEIEPVVEASIQHEQVELIAESLSVKKDVIRKQRDQNFTSNVRASERVNKEQLGTITIKNIKNKKNVVWCSASNVDRYQDLITTYEYYNVYTFISPHVLYDNALDYLGITHITEMEQCINKDYSVTRIGAKNKKEIRAMELLSKIENLFGLSETFLISDIACKLKVEIKGKKVHQEKLAVLGYAQGHTIHLNRKDLFFGKLSSQYVGNEHIGLHDLKFLIANVDIMAHELAHVLRNTNDNTKEHLEEEEKIRKEIIGFIISQS